MQEGKVRSLIKDVVSNLRPTKPPPAPRARSTPLARTITTGLPTMTLDEARKHFTRYEDANAFFEEYEAAQEKYALEKFQQKTLENTIPSMVRDAFKEFDDYVKYYAPQLYEKYMAAEFIVGRTELLEGFFPRYKGDSL